MAAEEAALMRLAAANGDFGVARSACRRACAGRRSVSARSPSRWRPAPLGDLVVRRDGAVEHVVVGGRLVVDDGVLTTADADAIAAEARAEATRLWGRMAAHTD